MISVIVPVYNAEKYLRQCMDSILSQTLQNLEVICVDDGSIDESASILDHYAEIDRRVKVIHKENGGLVSARKTGLKAAKGAYIGYVDSDDWIEPDMYEKLLAVLADGKADIAMCGRFEDTGNVSKAVHHGIPEGYYDKRALLEKVYPGMIVNGAFFEWGIFPGVWDKLFRREKLEPFQMAVDGRIVMGEDAACTYPAILNADNIYILHECLYHYRQSASSMVKQDADPEAQRKGYHILYHSVNEVFEKYRYIYDLRKQWREYLLFLMVPRADVLYEGVEKLDFLFPFPEIKKGSRVIVYGMGTYGQRLYRYLKSTGFCRFVACVDRNYEELSRQGFPVEPPEAIGKYAYDAVAVAVSFAEAREGIRRELERKYPSGKVHVIDEKLVKDGDSLKAFGLLSGKEQKE